MALRQSLKILQLCNKLKVDYNDFPYKYQVIHFVIGSQNSRISNCKIAPFIFQGHPGPWKFENKITTTSKVNWHWKKVNVAKADIPVLIKVLKAKDIEDTNGGPVMTRGRFVNGCVNLIDDRHKHSSVDPFNERISDIHWRICSHCRYDTLATREDCTSR